jgi:predicted ribosome quality control (RQC) complex YloA/Tae2 family protein
LFHEYTLPGGWKVLAGKNDEENDLLSTEVAQPEDWWFHVRSTPGSHVVLQVPEGEEPGRDVLKAAAAIAAWHSKARGAGKVAVSYTRACNVSKPRRSPTGTVTIRREGTLKVRPALPPEEKQ